MKTKKFLLLIPCAFMVLLLTAAENVKTINGVARANVKTVNGVARANVKSVNGVDNTAGGGGFLVEEDFEGVGTPAGWSASGGSDFDYTSVPLVGVESLRTTGGVHYARVDFTAQDEVWLFLAFRTVDRGGTRGAMFFNNTTELGRISFGSDGKIYATHGSVSVGSSATGIISNNTTVYLWARFVKGTGSNGVMELYGSASTTKPGSPDASVSTGTSTAQIDSIRFGDTDFGVATITDYVRVDDASIGSAP